MKLCNNENYLNYQFKQVWNSYNSPPSIWGVSVQISNNLCVLKLSLKLLVKKKGFVQLFLWGDIWMFQSMENVIKQIAKLCQYLQRTNFTGLNCIFAKGHDAWSIWIQIYNNLDYRIEHMFLICKQWETTSASLAINSDQ